MNDSLHPLLSLRRLVRELNALPSFWADLGHGYNTRCDRARLHKDTVTGVRRIEVHVKNAGWWIPKAGFGDGNGGYLSI